ncbi:MAG: PhoPQ-activated protein PqaA family protein [Gammaproteobacteria bacterium]|nr:PhoPQ-activated protein PqaA family protein [Gammaproteobacteria bacterium]
MSRYLIATVLLTLAMLSKPVLGDPPPADYRNSIDAYVAAKDRSFDWRASERILRDGYETVLIDMTSQRWLKKNEVDRQLWRHRLILTIPEELHSSDIAFLYISGGSNDETPQRESRDLVRQIALTTGTVVAELRHVPNQPLVFREDGEPRYEDNLIAYAWVQYLQSGDPTWLPRNAMVKSAVRAMDVISEFMRKYRDGKHQIHRFVVGGGSKRGWTTWLTGAMDRRVVAIVPIVIDVLNIDVSMRHHFAAYGYWAPSIGDYVNHGIMQRMGNDELKRIYDLVDPLRYVNRLDIPQFVVNASGDQFFLPDSAQFYWHHLLDQKYLRYVPNTNHGLGNSDGGESIAAFHFAVTRNIRLPELAWEYQNDHEVDVIFGTVPNTITLWQATNEDFRDFRIETFGPGYQATLRDTTALEPGSARRYRVESPPVGWKAWYLEMSYDIGFVRPLKLSTEIRVTPDNLPFEGKAPNLPTSVTFVLYDLDSTDGLFDAASAHLNASGLGTELSVATQGNRTYLNFQPQGDARVAYITFAGFLRNRFGDNLNASLQLESGIGATLAPIMR